MKRTTFILGTLLLFSLAINVKYALSSRKAVNNVNETSSSANLQSNARDSIETKYGIPRQQYATEQSWMNCILKLGIQSDVVFYGDSHSRWSDFRQYFPDVSICNLGLSGDNLNGFIRRIGMIQQVQPKKIFFMGGVNRSGTTSLEEYRLKYDILFSAIIDSLPKARLYIQSMLPLNPCVYDKYCDNDKVKQINAIQKDVANKYGLTYIDLYSVYAKDDILPMEVSRDGIHLKFEEYQKWAEAIKPYIYE